MGQRRRASGSPMSRDHELGVGMPLDDLSHSVGPFSRVRIPVYPTAPSLDGLIGSPGWSRT